MSETTRQQYEFAPKVLSKSKGSIPFYSSINAEEKKGYLTLTTEGRQQHRQEVWQRLLFQHILEFRRVLFFRVKLA